MALVLGEVSFPERPPSLEALAEKMTARGGLPVRAEPVESEPGWYRLHGRLSFACLPGLSVEVYCYSEEQRRRNVEMFVEFGLVSPKAGEEPLQPGCVVHVRSYLGVEPTLFFQTELALEELGGTLREPFDEETRRQYGGPLSEDELLRRVRDQAAAMRPVWWASAFLMPLLLPVHLAWTLVRLPWLLWRAHRLLRERGGFPFVASEHGDVSEGITLPPRCRQPPSEGPS
jgi:hypothetical protein